MTEAERAEDFARHFNQAAYRLKGFKLGDRVPPDTLMDVQRMVDTHQERYSRAFADGRDPAQVAREITDLWWDRR